MQLMQLMTVAPDFDFLGVVPALPLVDGALATRCESKVRNSEKSVAL